MKDFRLLIWLTQLGLSTAAPLVGFVLLAVWLYRACHWGSWVIVVGVILGIVSAVDGLRMSLKAIHCMDKKDTKKPPAGFNDHQ